MDQYDKRIAAVEREMSQIAGEVHSLVRSTAQLASVQQSTQDRLDRIADMIEADRGGPPEWSTRDVIGTVAGVCFTIAVTIGSLFLGLAGYVDGEVDTISTEVRQLNEWKQDKDEFQREMHHEVGINKTVQEYVATELARLWTHIHKLEEEDKGIKDRISEVESETAEAEVSRRAIGDYAKEHATKPGH